MSQEKQVFTKDNLSDLLRLQADALDRGEVLEFEEFRKELGSINFYSNSPFYAATTGYYYSTITLKPKPQMRKATVMEWLEWSCDYEKCKGWVVKYLDEHPMLPQFPNYFGMNEMAGLEELKRAKFENGKLGEFDYFWVEV